MSEASTFFNVYRAPNGKFYLTRESELVRTQSGGIVLFDTQQDVVEFLAEMGNVAASLGRGGSNQILTIFTNNLKACSQDCVDPKRAATSLPRRAAPPAPAD